MWIAIEAYKPPFQGTGEGGLEEGCDPDTKQPQKVRIQTTLSHNDLQLSWQSDSNGTWDGVTKRNLRN